MSTRTSKHGFYKPSLSDFANIEDMNENWDKIDEELPTITYGTEELIEGESELPTGTLHFVYE